MHWNRNRSCKLLCECQIKAENSLLVCILFRRFCVHIEEALDQLQSQLQDSDENDENYQSLYVDRSPLLILNAFFMNFLHNQFRTSRTSSVPRFFELKLPSSAGALVQFFYHAFDRKSFSSGSQVNEVDRTTNSWFYC